MFTYDEWKAIVEWSGAGAFVAWNLYGLGADKILVRMGNLRFFTLICWIQRFWLERNKESRGGDAESGYLFSSAIISFCLRIAS